MSRGFSPNRKYKVVLGKRLADSEDGYTTASIKLDSEVKLPTSVQSARLKPGFDSDTYELALTASDGKDSTYIGRRQATKTCALIYDQTSGTFLLERIDTQLSFAAEDHSPKQQSEAAILSSLIEDEGPAEEDNPFDWRHQLRRQRTPTPDFEQFTLDTGATPSPAPSPAPRHSQARPRRASSPGMTFEFEEPSPAPQSYAEPEEFEIGGEEESEDEGGGLEIDWGGPGKPENVFGRGRLTNRSNDTGPMSLRSAANSQSPAIHRELTPESDGDVEQPQLRSPIKIEKPVEAEPEELDLEKEFEIYMEEELDPPAQPATSYQVVEDSSSESEED